MKKLLIAMALLGLAACGPQPHANAHRYHMRDGRWAIQSDDGIWYWYVINMALSNNGSPSYYTGPVTGTNNNVTLIKGNPPTEEEEQGAAEEQVELNTEAESEGAEVTESATESTGGETSSGGEASSGGGDSGGGGGDSGGGGGGGE